MSAVGPLGVPEEIAELAHLRRWNGTERVQDGGMLLLCEVEPGLREEFSGRLAVESRAMDFGRAGPGDIFEAFYGCFGDAVNIP